MSRRRSAQSVFTRIVGWLVLLARSSAAQDAPGTATDDARTAAASYDHPAHTTEFRPPGLRVVPAKPAVTRRPEP